MVSPLLITFLLFVAVLLGVSFRVEALQAGFPDSQPVSTPQDPRNPQNIVVVGTSWTAMSTDMDVDLLKLSVTLRNDGNQRVQYFKVRVRYKSKFGEPLGGRDHYMRESINPGQPIQMSLPESRPPDADGKTSVNAMAIPKIALYGQTIQPIGTNLPSS